jgi:large subunit ribosomal protein L9
MSMTVILNDYIEHLGERGDSVRVKPGYARNYLLPKGLAYIDTPGNRKRFEEEQHRWEEMDLKRRSAAETVSGEMNGLELIFERRAGEKDVLFGSVTSVDIAKELVERGFEIDKRRVLLAEPIKELGSTTVDIHIHRDVSVTVPIHVVRPGEQPKAADADEGADAEATETEADTGDDGVAAE